MSDNESHVSESEDELELFKDGNTIYGEPPEFSQEVLDILVAINKTVTAPMKSCALSGSISRDIIKQNEVKLTYSTDEYHFTTVDLPFSLDDAASLQAASVPIPVSANWDRGFQKAAPDISLSPDPVDVSGLAETIRQALRKSYKLHVVLSKLIIHGPGDSRQPHQDPELRAEEHHIGTVLLSLPSFFQGGQIIIHHPCSSDVIDWASPNHSKSGTPAPSFFRWAFLHADCKYGLLPVKTGSMIVAHYDVFGYDAHGYDSEDPDGTKIDAAPAPLGIYVTKDHRHSTLLHRFRWLQAKISQPLTLAFELDYNHPSEDYYTEDEPEVVDLDKLEERLVDSDKSLVQFLNQAGVSWSFKDVLNFHKSTWETRDIEEVYLTETFRKKWRKSIIEWIKQERRLEKDAMDNMDSESDGETPWEDRMDEYSEERQTRFLKRKRALRDDVKQEVALSRLVQWGRPFRRRCLSSDNPALFHDFSFDDDDGECYRSTWTQVEELLNDGAETTTNVLWMTRSPQYYNSLYHCLAVADKRTMTGASQRAAIEIFSSEDESDAYDSDDPMFSETYSEKQYRAESPQMAIELTRLLMDLDRDEEADYKARLDQVRKPKYDPAKEKNKKKK